MNIAIRVDASKTIGTGHVMRCLSLAEQFKKNCTEIIFVCRDLPGNLISEIELSGHQVLRLQKDEEFDVNVTNEDFEYASWLQTNWNKDALETYSVLEPFATLDWLIMRSLFNR